MKKLLLILSFATFSIIVTGQVYDTVNVSTPGGFSSALIAGGGNPNTITNLTVTGNINSNDIFYMRNNMLVLAVVNMEEVKITGNELPANAFMNKTTLTGIKMPDSIVSIGVYAFSGCTGLTGTLTIPNTVKTIESGAFQGCKGLSGSLIIPNSVDTIGISTFEECTGFNGTLTLSNTLKYIGYNAFNNCKGLNGSLIIPNSVTYLGDNAFNKCSGFNSKLTISDSITSIDNSTFYGCSGFTDTLDIPGSVTTIGNDAFNGCKGFTALSLSGSVTTILNSAFFGCSGFKGTLTLPDSVTYIGGNAFNGCSGFSGNLVIPNSVTSISGSSFSGCSGFNGTLTLPAYLNSIGDYAFINCGFTGSLIIPNNTTSIGSNAFGNCTGFTGTLSLPALATSIGNSAFYHCSFTGTLTIPNSVTSIGDYAFAYCDSFKGNLTIPNSVISIGDYAFRNCTGFDGTLSIPNSVNSIGSLAFYNFYNIKKISVNIAIPLTIEQNTFYGMNKSICELIVPAGSKAAYEVADYWKEFTNIKEAYFVTFDAQGGSVVSAVTADSGTTISEPLQPILTGYSFGGWYKEVACINIWNFSTDLVKSNITLYAKWTIKTFNVSFNTLGGSFIPDLVANYGTTITAPISPSRFGYSFEDWYIDPECIYIWDFDVDIITSDTTLYAKWISESNFISTSLPASVKLFPNPVSELLTIQGENIQQITLCNISGEVLMQANLMNMNRYIITLSRFKSGCYLVYIKKKNTSPEVFKLLKK
jgi:uncharacterized repeat protein (TIGR02543 family)